MEKINHCLDCGKIIKLKSKRCGHCAQLGKNNHQYKYGYRSGDLPHCIDCGVIITYQRTRCKTCSRKFQIGKNNPNYKDGRFQIKINKCIDCNKLLKNMSAIRCQSCAMKEIHCLGVINFKGKNNPAWKGGITLKKYYCKEEGCNNEISYQVGRFRSGKCRSCAYKFMVGENAPNWRGGIGFEPYPISWTEELREQIRKRDNHQCQLCGKTEKQNKRKLDVHHIDYDKENLNLDNLISLCRGCHMKTNGNREFWQTVLTKGKYKCQKIINHSSDAKYV